MRHVNERILPLILNTIQTFENIETLVRNNKIKSDWSLVFVIEAFQEKIGEKRKTQVDTTEKSETKNYT